MQLCSNKLIMIMNVIPYITERNHSLQRTEKVREMVRRSREKVTIPDILLAERIRDSGTSSGA